jgi:hypothetical protein
MRADARSRPLIALATLLCDGRSLFGLGPGGPNFRAMRTPEHLRALVRAAEAELEAATKRDRNGDLPPDWRNVLIWWSPQLQGRIWRVTYEG